MVSFKVPSNVPLPEEDDEQLHKAFAGWGINEKLIISILAHRNSTQRSLIRSVYASTYNEDLLKALDKELSSDFESFASAGYMELKLSSMDSNKHMFVIVVLNSVELQVDLVLFPGQLVPRSATAIFMSHITPAGESDSAENDSCDSPLEPNSPLYERRDPESPNASGQSLHKLMLRPATALERKWRCAFLPSTSPRIVNQILPLFSGDVAAEK